MLVWTGAVSPSLGIPLKHCRVENVTTKEKQDTTTIALPGHQTLRPQVAESPKAGYLHCQSSWWGVLGPVWCGRMWELALDGGSHAAGYP